MIQYIDISTSGEVQVVSGRNNQYVFELSDPDIPVDIKYLLDTLLNVDPQAGLVAVHLERGNGREFTTATYSGGIVVGSDGVGGQFDVIMNNLQRLAVAINQVPLPAPPPRIPNLTFAQLMIGLVAEGWITEAEGGAWLVGTLPDPVLLVISMLPPEQQFAAKARAIRPSEIIRNDPLVAALATAEGKTSAEIDDFFLTYSGV
jgi:hypothetical protein